jgi:hypothetical protein
LRIYQQLKDGRIDNLRISPLSYYETRPHVGDTICDLLDGKWRYYVVISRYFVEAGIGSKGWAILVRETDETDVAKALTSAWVEDDEFLASHEPEEIE